VKLVIEGTPCPKGRPRFARGQVFTDAKTTAAELRIKVAARRAGWNPILGHVSVAIDYVMPDRRVVDLDNLVKLTLDGLNGTGWNDDSQVVVLYATKRVEKGKGSTTVCATEIE
jgi:Holliday junction resolvase RusA-like endonuclease